MADLSDVLDAVSGLAVMAVYPNGTGFASVTGRQVTVGSGWPKPADLDAAFKQNPPASLITVFSPPMSTAVCAQVFEEPPQVVIPAVFGLAAPVIGPQWAPWTVTLSGTPIAGEYITAVVDRVNHYTYTVVAGNSLNTVATNLAALINVDYPGTIATGPVLTIQSNISLAVRQGAIVTMGHLIHRQKQNIRVSVWAPNNTDRVTISKAVDVLLKQNLHLTFPDTSQGVMTYEATMLDDNSQNTGAYRRDIVMGVEYGTMETFPAYIITSATMTLAALPIPGDFLGLGSGTSNISVN